MEEWERRHLRNVRKTRIASRVALQLEHRREDEDGGQGKVKSRDQMSRRSNTELSLEYRRRPKGLEMLGMGVVVIGRRGVRERDLRGEDEAKMAAARPNPDRVKRERKFERRTLLESPRDHRLMAIIC